jgi:hypothetical protein
MFFLNKDSGLLVIPFKIFNLPVFNFDLSNFFKRLLYENIKISIECLITRWRNGNAAGS